MERERGRERDGEREMERERWSERDGARDHVPASERAKDRVIGRSRRGMYVCMFARERMREGAGQQGRAAAERFGVTLPCAYWSRTIDPRTPQ